MFENGSDVEQSTITKTENGPQCAFSVNITQTRPCNIQQYFTAVKMLVFRSYLLIFF